MKKIHSRIERDKKQILNVERAIICTSINDRELSIIELQGRSLTIQVSATLVNYQPKTNVLNRDTNNFQLRGWLLIDEHLIGFRRAATWKLHFFAEAPPSQNPGVKLYSRVNNLRSSEKRFCPHLKTKATPPPNEQKKKVVLLKRLGFS